LTSQKDELLQRIESLEKINQDLRAQNQALTKKNLQINEEIILKGCECPSNGDLLIAGNLLGLI
jgi:hypothetical protein